MVEGKMLLLHKCSNILCLILCILVVWLSACMNVPVVTPVVDVTPLETPADIPPTLSVANAVEATITSTKTLPTAVKLPTDTATPVATETSTPFPTETPQPTETSAPTNTPIPQPESTSRYPTIPEGQSLLYVINFFGDELQFRFEGQMEPYRVPGKSVAPEGGVRELFLQPGHYKWAGVVEFVGVSGGGEFDLAAGEIQGLGIAEDHTGLIGFLIGPDPLAPPATPTPVPTLVPPSKPSAGKVTFVYFTPEWAIDATLTFLDQAYALIPGERLVIELEPGFYDITMSYFSEPIDCPNGAVCLSNDSHSYKVDLLANHICELQGKLKQFTCWLP